jgi:hypothetical protein
MHPDFIEKIDHAKKTVHLLAPDGLIDFYLGETTDSDEEE